jgi:uncharacterized protein (TIGR02466 family)
MLDNIKLWFPTAIYYEENLLSEKENAQLKQYCLGLEDKVPSGGLAWYGKTYTTHGSYSSLGDEEVQVLLRITRERVNAFARVYGCVENYECRTPWLNISREGNWQEFHVHPGVVFSAVYYVAAPEGSGNIVFEDPRGADMCPLKNVVEKNTFSFDRVPYAAKENSLIIFRSYLRHMVEPGSNVAPRISFAMNFG